MAISQKSEVGHLKNVKVGRWDDSVIVPVSDGPMHTQGLNET